MRDSERKTLAFIEQFIAEHGFSPKLNEIATGIGISSKGTVSRYIQALIDQGALAKAQGKQRGLSLLRPSIEHLNFTFPTLPLVGTIAAGKPIEAIEQDETLSFSDFLGGSDLFVLRVRGESMQDEGILDGDYVICHAQSTAKDGDIVVALIDGDEATLKRLYWQGSDKVKLVPANQLMAPMFYDAHRVQIQGVFRGLLRVAT